VFSVFSINTVEDSWIESSLSHLNDIPVGLAKVNK